MPDDRRTGSLRSASAYYLVFAQRSLHSLEGAKPPTDKRVHAIAPGSKAVRYLHTEAEPLLQASSLRS